MNNQDKKRKVFLWQELDGDDKQYDEDIIIYVTKLFMNVKIAYLWINCSLC
jgi:hypothetical protein